MNEKVQKVADALVAAILLTAHEAEMADNRGNFYAEVVKAIVEHDDSPTVGSLETVKNILHFTHP